MSTLVILLRAASLLAFAAPLSLTLGRRRGVRGTRAHRESGARAPVAANIATFVLFFVSFALFSGSAEVPLALPAALAGCLLALAGAVLILKSRIALGSAWSFVPRADQQTGLATTGPYRLVRHPIYLGLILIAAGEAFAFATWPALAIVALGIVPTFVWRARAEEALLSRTFGDRYAAYRRRTRMILPFLL